MEFTELFINQIKSHVGDFEIIGNLRESSTRTGVIKIKTKEQMLFVKIHNRASRANPEIFAYQNWTPILESFTPNLLHVINSNTNYLLVLTALNGKTINESGSVDNAILEQAYYNAGKLLKKLHASFQGSYFGIPSIDGTPYEKTVEKNAVNYVMRSLESIVNFGLENSIFDNSDKELFNWCEKNIDVLNNEKPVPTNWDYSPNNWIINDHGFVGIIDFENMLWGIGFDSFGVIAERYTQDKPHLFKSFLSGYDFMDNEINQTKLNIVLTKAAMADILFGYSGNIQRNITCGKELVAKIKKEVL